MFLHNTTREVGTKLGAITTIQHEQTAQVAPKVPRGLRAMQDQTYQGKGGFHARYLRLRRPLYHVQRLNPRHLSATKSTHSVEIVSATIWPVASPPRP